MTLEQIEQDIVNGPILPPSEWQAVAAVCEASTARDQEQCQRFRLASRLSGREQVETYLKIFLDTKFQPRPNLLTQGLAKKQPGLAQRLRDEQTRVLPLRNCAMPLPAVTAVQRCSRSRRKCWSAMAGKSSAAGWSTTTTDRQSARLLRNTDAAWVHYKLDLGIDHLLIDEAQDTSTKQWEIVQRLVAEFTAGAGARPGKRTIFAVGDEKQSIFSFQNAAPHEFAEMRKYFQKRHEESELKFEYRQLEHSFRSCESVLNAVDIVFKDIAGSVTSDSKAAYRLILRCPMRRRACRNLGHHQAGEARADRRLGRAVRYGERSQPAGEACAPHCAHRAAADRRARAGWP